MFVTKKRLLEEVRKAKLEGITEGKQDLERQVEMSKERGIKEGYNMGHSDRTNFYTMSVIPEKEKYLEHVKSVARKRRLIIKEQEEEIKELKNEVATYEVANKSLREIGERLMFRVGELKEDKENDLRRIEQLATALEIREEVHEVAIHRIENLKNMNEGLKLENYLCDFQEIKRLEELMKKVKRVKVKKKIQSRIDKLMIRGL